MSTPEGAISYLESSGFLANGWSTGETLGNWNFIMVGFLRLTRQAVTGQPIKKCNSYFNFPGSPLGTNCWPKNLRTLFA